MTICNMTIEGGGRAGHDRARRHDVRVDRGPPGRARGQLRGGGRPPGASCAPTTARRFDREITVDAGALCARSSPGAPRPAMVVPARRPERSRSRSPTATSARSTTWASSAGTPMQEIRARPRLHRLLHQRPHRRPARRRRGGRGPQGRRATSDAMVVPGSQPVARPGRGRGARRGLPRRRLRLARRRLLDVPGHEPRHPPARRALRLDLEPQLRGPPGPRRAHPPRLARRWPPRPPSRATSSTSGSGS